MNHLFVGTLWLQQQEQKCAHNNKHEQENEQTWCKIHEMSTKRKEDTEATLKRILGLTKEDKNEVKDKRRNAIEEEKEKIETEARQSRNKKE